MSKNLNTFGINFRITFKVVIFKIIFTETSLNIKPTAMISRKRVRDFNKILTCLLCKGYLIEATTINTCMHSCKLKQKSFKYFLKNNTP